MESYKTTIKFNVKADRVFDALINKIPFWWTELFEGLSDQKGNRFTIRFGDNIYKTMLVEEIFPNTRIVWRVEDARIGISELKNQTEWINTIIVWQITPHENFSELVLHHIGLNKEIECYDICVNGWQQFLNSFRSYVEFGKGYPFSASNE